MPISDYGTGARLNMTDLQPYSSMKRRKEWKMIVRNPCSNNNRWIVATDQITYEAQGRTAHQYCLCRSS